MCNATRSRGDGSFVRAHGTARSMRDKAEETMSRERSHAAFVVLSCSAVLLTLLGVVGISRSVLASSVGPAAAPGPPRSVTPRAPRRRPNGTRPTMRGRSHRRRGHRPPRRLRGWRVVARVPARRAGGRRADALLAHHEETSSRRCCDARRSTDRGRATTCTFRSRGCASWARGRTRSSRRSRPRWRRSSTTRR